MSSRNNRACASNVQKIEAYDHKSRSLEVRFTAHNFRRLDGVHFLQISSSRLNLPHRTHFVRGVSWYAYVILAFKNELDVTDFKSC